MNEHLPDFHEMGEAKLEKMCEGDNIKCIECEVMFPIAQATPSGPSPYAAPLCPKCANNV